MVQFEAADAAATPDGAEAGGAAPETPLPDDAARPLLAESGHLGRPLLQLRPDEASLIFTELIGLRSPKAIHLAGSCVGCPSMGSLNKGFHHFHRFRCNLPWQSSNWDLVSGRPGGQQAGGPAAVAAPGGDARGGVPRRGGARGRRVRPARRPQPDAADR